VSKRFERLGAKLEVLVIGAVIVVIAIAYFLSRLSGVSPN